MGQVEVQPVQARLFPSSAVDEREKAQSASLFLFPSISESFGFVDILPVGAVLVGVCGGGRVAFAFVRRTHPALELWESCDGSGHPFYSLYFYSKSVSLEVWRHLLLAFELQLTMPWSASVPWEGTLVENSPSHSFLKNLGYISL